MGSKSAQLVKFLSDVSVGTRAVLHGMFPIFNGGFRMGSVATVTKIEMESVTIGGNEVEIALVTVSPDERHYLLDEWDNTWKVAVGLDEVDEAILEQYMYDNGGIDGVDPINLDPNNKEGYHGWGDYFEVLKPGEPETVRADTLALWEQERKECNQYVEREQERYAQNALDLAEVERKLLAGE